MIRRILWSGVPPLALALLALFLPLPIQSQDSLSVGYAEIRADSENLLPVSSALFSFRNAQGVLVSEAAVEAVRPLTRGRILVDQQGGVSTGIALVNGSPEDATIQLVLRDQDGAVAGASQLEVPAGHHLSKFVSEILSQATPGFLGSLTFETDEASPVAPITIRLSANSYGEPLFATLPVVNLTDTESSGDTQVIFPHIGAGGILSTQILLINTDANSIQGLISLVGTDGLPLVMELDGVSGSEFAYNIPGNGIFRGTLRASDAILQGYAVVTSSSGPTLPSGTAVFQFRDAADRLVSEAGVAATPPTHHVRMFVDTVDTQTGVALALPEMPGFASSIPTQTGPHQISFELFDLQGNSIGIRAVEMELGEQAAFFTGDARLFPEVASGFQGILEIESPIPMVPVTLKFTVNERGEPILTTLPLADVERPLPDGSRILPQIGFGLGFSTRLIMINSSSEQQAKGSLIFRTSAGDPFEVTLGDVGASEFRFDLGPALGNDGSNLRPVLPAALIQLPSSEIVVSVGTTSPIEASVIDTAGLPIENAEIVLTSLDPEIATVDGNGLATGMKRGFSTLIIESGDLIETATITVVNLNSGSSNFDIGGLAQDTSGQIYLASRNRHSILLTQGLGEEPATYAGIPNQAGSANGERLSSRFRNPTSLALNQFTGVLYVTDRDNHSIRLIESGQSGRVFTLAGSSGVPGSSDGSSAQAKFRNPGAIALDDSGQLWVADTGNHTVRRIGLVTGMVTTVAGKAGESGAADGIGTEARFNTPVAIAIERESLAAQSERERLNLPRPPITVLVADRGNNVIRRVSEDGMVETVASGATGPAGIGSPALFESPSSVIVDPFGLIFVGLGNGNVQAILPNGDVVNAVKPGTFSNPGQMAIVEGGRLLVADGNSPGREIVYGAPSLDSVEPSEVAPEGGDPVTIAGQNFGPETIVVVGGILVDDVEVENSRSIHFVTPPLRSGVTTLSVQNRGGTAQRSFFVQGIPLDSLPPGHITTVAGGSTYIGDGLFARDSFLRGPSDVALSANGDLFVADTSHIRVRRIDSETGVITTVAGTGDRLQSAPDSGPATATPLNFPRSILIDSNGDLLIADRGIQGIRRVDSVTGNATILISTPELGNLYDMAFDEVGNIVVSVPTAIYRVNLETQEVVLIAGGTQSGFSGDGGPALGATFRQPEAIAVDQQGNVFVADSFNNRIRRIDKVTQLIETVAGNGNFVCCGSGFVDGPATQTGMGNPSGLAFDQDGNLLVADTQGHAIRKLTLGTGMISTIPVAGGSLLGPRGLLVDGSGTIIIADTFHQQVKRIDPQTGEAELLVGTGATGPQADGGPAIGASLEIGERAIITTNRADDLFIADFRADRVRIVDGQTGTINTLAGGASCPPNCSSGYGDGGPANEAYLAIPRGLVIDSEQLYIAENWRIRRVDLSTGIITTVAGTGDFGYSGDGGPALEAQFAGFLELGIDANGNLLIVDEGRIRRVDHQTGIIDTVVGTGVEGYSGDGGDARLAQFLRLVAIATDRSGNIYIADSGNQRIRRVDVQTGVVTTIAGSGPGGFASGGFSGDGGLATEASLRLPEGVAVDENSLYIADRGNARVRRVDLATGIIDTVAGGQCCGADGSSALEIHFLPYGLALDSQGNLFVGDIFNESVRAIRAPIP